MTVEKYHPVIREEKGLNLSKKFGSEKLNSMVDKNGIIKTKLNEEVIIQAVSHKLYKDPESALRELYNNEAYHGCLVAQTKHNTKPYIKVSLNTTDRKLIIQGFNSLGITEEVFAEILLELGTSGNLDRTKTGKFGMGFASYTKLSDIMILETNCINGDCYTLMAKGGLGFDPNLPKPKLEKTGTRLTLTLRENVDYEKLVTMLTNLAKTSGIKTYFELQTPKKINEFESGLHILPQKSYKEIFEEHNNGEKDRFSYLKSSFVNDQIEVHLSIAVHRDGSFTNNRNKEFYLCNSPIEVTLDEGDNYRATNDLDEDEDQEAYKKAQEEQKKYKNSRIDDIEFETLIVNMKDEDTFEPMQDRERTTTEAEIKIRKIVLDLYYETLKKIKPCEDLKSWFNHEHKYFILSDEAEIVKSLDDKSKTVQKLLNTEVFKYEINERLKYDGVDLSDIIPDKEHYFYVLKKDKRVQDLIFENFDSSYMVMVNPDKDIFENNKVRFNDTIKTLKYFGFKDAKQTCKDNNLKQKRSISIDGEEKTVKNNDEIVLHYSGTISNQYGYNYNRTTFCELTRTEIIGSDDFNKIKDQIIRVSPFAKYRDVLKQIKTDFDLISDKKGLEDINSIESIEKHFRDTFFKVETNKGLLSLDQILKHKTITVNFDAFDNSDEDTLRGLPEIDKKELYICTNKDIVFKLALIFIKNGIDYHIENENLDHYYKPKVVRLAKTLKLINEDLESRNSLSVYDFERYLFTVRDVEIKVQDEKLRKLFKLSHTEENFEEIKKDILELNENLRTEKIVIQRKNKEYFS